MTRAHTTGMNKHLRQARRTAGSDFSPHAFTEVDDTGPDDESPALIPKAVFSGVERKGRYESGERAVADEATGGMHIQADHEEKRQVVRVPERLEALVADRVVGGGIHEYHDEEQEVARDTTGLRIVYVQRDFGTDVWTVVGSEQTLKLWLVTYE